MKDESKCKKNLLCDFELSGDFPDALIEVCVQCGKKVIYNKVDGRIDNYKYLRDHIRNTVQPWGRTRNLFLKIYGEKTMTEVEKELQGKKTKEQIQREWNEMRKEIVNRERKQRIYI